MNKEALHLSILMYKLIELFYKMFTSKKEYIMNTIKKLWNNNPKKKWLVVGLVVGWALATYL